MIQLTFNNYINLECPDGFTELSEEENSKYFTGNLLRLSLHNKEKHLLISLSKSKETFINRFLNNVAVIRGSLSNMERNLKDYHLIEEYDSTIMDNPSVTACFSYTANDNDIKQYGQLSVFKVGKTIYAIYCLSRLEDKEESKVIFKQFIDSFTAL